MICERSAGAPLAAGRLRTLLGTADTCAPPGNGSSDMQWQTMQGNAQDHCASVASAGLRNNKLILFHYYNLALF